MAGILGAASIPFIGCVALLVAAILQIIALAAPYWAEDSDGDFGLWRRVKCKSDSEQCYKFYLSGVSDWFNASRALECCAIIFWSIPLVILPVYIYVALGLYYRCLMVSMTLFTLLGALCNIVGVVIFGIKADDKTDWDIGWCLIVAAIAFLFGIIAFIAFVSATCFRPKFVPHQSHFVSGFFVDPDKNRMYIVEEPYYEPEEQVKVAYNDGGIVNPAVVAD